MSHLDENKYVIALREAFVTAGKPLRMLEVCEKGEQPYGNDAYVLKMLGERKFCAYYAERGSEFDYGEFETVRAAANYIHWMATAKRLLI